MDTSVADNRKKSRFEIYVDGRFAGFISYERTASTVSFTEIDTDLGLAGQGLGLQLVRGALNAAAAQGLSVLPTCPFVRSYIERHPVFVDLVPPDQRERFDLPPTQSSD